MIRVTLELVSAVSPDRDRCLGIGYISNTGRCADGSQNKYIYEVWLSKTLPGRTKEEWKRGRAAVVDDQLITDQMKGEIVGFDNVKRGAWDLLYLALRNLLHGRNPR